MKVLVLDRDRDACDQLQSILTGIKADVTFEPIKNAAMELVKQNQYDVIFYDPSPQNEMRSFIMGIRRSLNAFPPILILSHQLDRKQVLAAGGNDLVLKPLDRDDVIKKAQAGERISKIARLMADEATDFPSKEGIIAKSAFNQLFITCLDRSDRHAETSYLIFINVENLADIEKADGPDEAKKVAYNLRRTISRTRRTSDIAGQTKDAEFSILLLPPSRDNAKEDEHFLAANRIVETLKSNVDIISTAPTKAQLKVWLLEIPSGNILAEHTVAPSA